MSNQKLPSDAAAVKAVLPSHPDEALNRVEIGKLTGLPVGRIRNALDVLLSSNAINSHRDGPRSNKYSLADASTITTPRSFTWQTKTMSGYSASLARMTSLRTGGR